ncbi:MAG TPA: peptidylprolyl isomerase [Candidatus Eisenbacteria bacterium]|jgi:peptidyl-prolyl cis-trans isomerase D|nr:peptidylprolyl isomerase [Candidatus Eisenbacteria bacterium]
MAGALDNKQILVKIFIGIFVGLIGISMLLYLVPQGPGTGADADTSDVVAKVGNQSVSLAEVRQQLSEIQRRNQVPKALEGLYARQILNQLVFTKEIEYEAGRLGIKVTNEEIADRVKQFLPTAFNGDSPVGMDQYTQQVQQRFSMTVPVFENLVRQGLLEEKFRRLVTDGVSVGPNELQEQFRYQNEKIKLNYTLIKPEDLESKITLDDAAIKAYYEKNKSRYTVAEKRVVEYGLLDLAKLRQSVQISDDDLKIRYQQDIQQYQVPNRVHAQHILFMTVGKPDAEVDEIKKKAEDTLKQVKKGAKFDELAKKYSEDPGSKEKGGDLGWLVQGQTVPEFEKAAFSLPPGAVSDLVKTQYGFHIIKVLEKETAHTKPFDEVKDSIRAPLVLTKAEDESSKIAEQIASTVRKSNKTPLADLAKEFHLEVAQTRPVAVTDPLLELGNSNEVKERIFQLREGEVSSPIRTDRGYVVLSLKQLFPTHQGTLEEVRDKVISALKQEKSVELARTKAEELSKRVRAGEKLDSAAKALGLDSKTSEEFSRAGSVPNLGSGKQLSAAFSMKAGDASAAVPLGTNWVVYRVESKAAANMTDFDKQKKELTDQVLNEKRSLAYEAFRSGLEERLKQEGKLKLMPEKMKSFGDLTSL